VKTGAKSKFYHPELDQLRFFAFLAVFLHHFFATYLPSLQRHGGLTARILGAFVESGGLGVDLFFCLSSFLITMLLLREHDLTGALDVRAFWVRRILRIWPLYYTFVLLSAVVVPLFAPENRLSGLHLAGFTFLAGNWACVANGYPNSVAAPLWSVSIEEQFYILWPLVLSIFGCRRLPHLAILCLVGASAMRMVAVPLGLPDTAVWCNTVARLDPIALGALLAVVCHRRPFSIPAWLRKTTLLVAALCPATLLLWFGDRCWAGKPSLVFYPTVAVSCVAILVAIYRGGNAPVPETASRLSKILVYLGRISYGLYVFHVLGIQLSQFLIQGAGGSATHKSLMFVLRFVLAGGVTFGLAALSYSWLETPFLRLKARFSHVDSAPPEPAGTGSIEREVEAVRS
jgi:peptidoglycan/LPS O-acetylase OafA/YrhL